MGTNITPLANPLPPPTERYSLLGWMHKNLFSSWYNTLLTIITLGLIYAILKPMLNWFLIQADWEVIQVNIRLLMVGQYPQEQIWRIWLCLYLLAAIAGLSWGVWVRGRWFAGLVLLAVPVLISLFPAFSNVSRQQPLILDLIALTSFGIGWVRGKPMRRVAVTLWLLYFPLVILIVRGLAFAEIWMPIVSSSLWGGLLLTFLLTIAGISFSFPLGVMLALGRRSSLPAIRWVSITYIEVIRGVPLVTILFMASVMVPLFLSSGTPPDRVLRAMLGITLFTSAYMAENVRGGLQAIPHGQYEAAQALGLSGFQTMFYIILPQALRLVIPVLLGLFIALFKDTSLVATIGLLELLGISRSILAQPQYVSFQKEVFIFISLIYWVVCYFMSYGSQRLEKSLGVGER
ncbi:MAG: amino acid ABC transporter permease [Chloroflexi bacterium RBG_16_52_11]|nr:MAG: amino acid ABC transporter permease [Chloroflexi bacterium RBG_16_52_11]